MEVCSVWGCAVWRCAVCGGVHVRCEGVQCGVCRDGQCRGFSMEVCNVEKLIFIGMDNIFLIVHYVHSQFTN